MDQNFLVIEQQDRGKDLIRLLSGAGIDITVAFWAKPSDEGNWYLYLSSPCVDKNGQKDSYRRINNVLRSNPRIGFRPSEIRVIGSKDPLAQAALAKLWPLIPTGSFAVNSPPPFRGMTVLGESMIAGMSVDGAYIYPTNVP